MKKKILLTMLCALLAVSMLAACGSTPSSTPASEPASTPESTPADDSTPATTGGPYTFGYTAMDGSNPFFVLIKDTMKEMVEANGDTLIDTDPANDSALQISQVEDLITQNIDGMFLNPVDKEGIRPALDQLADAGIPVVNFDTEVADMDLVATFIGSDNYNAGKVCGEDLVAQLPDGGPIIVLDSPTMQSVVDRTNGFLDAIEGKGFEVVGQKDSMGNLQMGMDNATDLIQANPDVVAIFGGNDPTALGALAAANAAGLTDCLIYGVDGSPDIKAEMAAGSLIRGSGAQSPIAIAETSVEVMYKLMAGEAVDERYPVETFMITPENVAEYGTDGWQ